MLIILEVFSVAKTVLLLQELHVRRAGHAPNSYHRPIQRDARPYSCTTGRTAAAPTVRYLRLSTRIEGMIIDANANIFHSAHQSVSVSAKIQSRRSRRSKITSVKSHAIP